MLCLVLRNKVLLNLLRVLGSFQQETPNADIAFYGDVNCETGKHAQRHGERYPSGKCSNPNNTSGSNKPHALPMV